MYKIISYISSIIRVFIFPNPFTKIFEVYLANTPFDGSALVIADLFNIFVGEGILYILCYPLVGLIYDRGEAPVIGSLLYMCCVLLNSWLLILVSNTLVEPNLASFTMRFCIVVCIEVGILAGIRYLKKGICY